jgi:ribonuclease III
MSAARDAGRADETRDARAATDARDAKSAIDLLAERLPHRFARREILELALVHRSSAAAGRNNEKLEFLGDAVLDLAVSDLLMERDAGANEGDLSKRRAALVNARVLATKAAELDLGSLLRLGRGEEKSGGRKKASILAAAYEAVIGAVFVDAGYAAARAIAAAHFRSELERGEGPTPIDHKSRLQEVTQRLFHETPRYSLVQAKGPDHDRAFVAELVFAGKCYGRGEGKSKKQAEQEAARQALAALESR